MAAYRVRVAQDQEVDHHDLKHAHQEQQATKPDHGPVLVVARRVVKVQHENIRPGIAVILVHLQCHEAEHDALDAHVRTTCHEGEHVVAVDTDVRVVHAH